ncbi:unnamed protein product, partial [Oppiella nova]
MQNNENDSSQVLSTAGGRRALKQRSTILKTIEPNCGKPGAKTTRATKSNPKAKHVSSVGSVGQPKDQKSAKESESQPNARPVAKVEPNRESDNDNHADSVVKPKTRNPNSPLVARFERPDPKKRFYFSEQLLYPGGNEEF